MSELGNKLVTSLIRDYYSNININDIAPDKIEQREFGFGIIGNKIAGRHYSFRDAEQLKEYLVSNAPAFVDYSAAYYREPSARPMERKGWLGSELRFDLDASDPKYDCKIHSKDWLCDERLEAVKRDTLLLIEDFLIGDFGFSEKEIKINFSGNRGYHVHITSDSVLQLDADAREELCSYIKPLKISSLSIFPDLSSKRKKSQFSGPKPSDNGWYGKIAKAFIEKLGSPKSLTELGIEERIAKKLSKEKELVEMGIRNCIWGITGIPMKDIYWNKVIEKIVWEKSVYIDANVTKDPSHLMRLAGTIHGGSGLVAKKLSNGIRELEKFDPMKDAIAFADSPLGISAKTPYALRMGDSTFGPYNGERAEVPIYVGVYLYLKGFADIISNQ
ncbi:MAG: DNA primase catalytic subunit PriS [Candidatus Micrarchaeaceae archaeon]